MAREWRSMVVALALATGLTLGAPIGADRASAEGIASGTTRLELSRGLFKALKRDDVRLTKTGPGRIRGRFVKLPVSGGSIDLPTATGSIESTGGFRFRAGRRSVKLTKLTLDTSKRGLHGTIAGRKLRLAAVKRYTPSRAGWGAAVAVRNLRLTRQASSLLNRKLGLDAFRPGRAFASVFSNVQPSDVQIVGGSFRLDFDAGTVAKIRSLGFELIPLASSDAQSDPPVFSSSLLGGQIDPTTALTWGYAEGGFRIIDPDSPGPSADWWNLGFSFETGKLLSSGLAHTAFGQLAPEPPAPLAAVDLAGAQVVVDPFGRIVTLSARATLEPGVADYINETFAESRGKAPVMAAGDPLGTVSMTLQGR